MKTPSGEHTIFDVTEFLPGRRIPNEYVEEAEANGPFFFIPSHWNDDDWGSWIAQHRGYPILYSTGFQTPEAALKAAIEWESTKEERQAQESKWLNFMREV